MTRIHNRLSVPITHSSSISVVIPLDSLNKSLTPCYPCLVTEHHLKSEMTRSAIKLPLKSNKNQNYYITGSTQNRSRRPFLFECHPRQHILNSQPSPEHPTLKSKSTCKNSSGQREVRLLHLPLICLLRPLSVPRTLPHPLQIRFQTTHTKGREAERTIGV